MVLVRFPNGETEEVTAPTDVELRTAIGGAYSPQLVNRIEAQRAGAVSTITTDCGTTESRREADLNYEVTIEGWAVEERLAELAQVGSGNQLVELTCDIKPANGTYEVREFTVEQNNEITTLIFTENSEQKEQLAFSFQLQLRDPNAEDTGN